jgi:hypothetical protein
LVLLLLLLLLLLLVILISFPGFAVIPTLVLVLVVRRETLVPLTVPLDLLLLRGGKSKISKMAKKHLNL